MRRKRNDIGTRSGSCACPRAWLLSFCLLAMLGLDLGAAHAQTSPPQRTPVVTSGSGQYYFEFRSRQAWDYGHTFVVFGRVGEPPSKNNVAGLSPKGDDPQMWLMGHYVPVPSDTGWTDGDLEDRYITSLTSASCRRNRRPGAWSYTIATHSLPTSQASWVLRYRLQAGFIRKSS